MRFAANCECGFAGYCDGKKECTKALRLDVDSSKLGLPTLNESDNVNHPAHYKTGGIETIDFLEAKLGSEGFKAYCRGNALKYLSRAGKKDPNKEIEDIKKAIWYLQREIETHEKEA